MTAPPGQCDEIRGGWSRRLTRIDSQVTHAYVHRHFWEGLRNQIVSVNPTADGGFLESYNSLYAESIMMTIRRLADPGENTDSLWRSWAAVKRNPTCATRARYLELAASHVGLDGEESASVRRQSDLHFTEWLGDGDHVDPDRLTRFQDYLRDDAKRVTDFVDKRIAHLDHEVSHPAAQSIDMTQIHQTLDHVAWNANQFHRLLDREWMAFELVVVPPTWRASLRSLFQAPPPAP